MHRTEKQVRDRGQTYKGGITQYAKTKTPQLRVEEKVHFATPQETVGGLSDK